MVEPAPWYQDMPKGFRFCPTDEELVRHYLRHKLLADDPSIHNTIPEIRICNYQPWELPAFSPINSDYPEWFFFSPCEYKYSNSTRSNRATSLGYWKVTCQDRKIGDRLTNHDIGTKKTLVFYAGHAPGIKTNWVIHEYHDALHPPSQRTFVLCRLLKKPDEKNKTKGKSNEPVYNESEPSNNIAFEYENQANLWTVSDVQNCYLSDMDSTMRQTPAESNEFVGSSVDPEVSSVDESESEEFDFTSLLRLSPSEDEQD